MRTVSVGLFVLGIFLGAVLPAAAQEDSPWLHHLRDLNDPNLSHEERAAAEAALLEFTDVEILRASFKIVAAPVGEWDATKPVPWSVPTRHRPGWALIPSARLRVFVHFARYAQPKSERKQIIFELFDEWETDFEFRQLIDVAIWNHSPQLERKLWSLFADREQDAMVRVSSASTLSQITHRHAGPSFRHYSRRIIEYAWEERGSKVATTLGGRGGGHALQNVLFLDWYEREQARAAELGHPVPKDVLDRIDQSFGNISGMHEEHRVQQDKAIAIIRQREALRDEARETGDDTELREFEAELAAKQQAELEERIEKIDAWIAANRERLEAEAEAYAREREVLRRPPADE